MQENIKDKLNGIPIDVSVKILDGNRKRRQAAPGLAPVLDSKEDPKTRSMVSTQYSDQGGSGKACFNFASVFRLYLCDLGHRCISARMVVAATMFVRATCRCLIATATGRLTEPSRRLKCESEQKLFVQSDRL